MCPILWKSSESLVKGAVCISEKLNIQKAIIGATAVAMGTSAAEIAVNYSAITGGITDLAVGNIVGSNIVNIGLGLGLSAFFMTISVNTKMMKKDIAIMLGASALLLLFIWDKIISYVESDLLMILFLANIAFIVYYTHRSMKFKEINKIDFWENGVKDRFQENEKTVSLKRATVLLFGGLLLLVVSARILVDSAVEIAHTVGISSYICGLTILGIGTSLPEIMSSVMAAKKNQNEIVLGNVFGTNIFNILFALGLMGLIVPLDASSALGSVLFLNVFNFGILLTLIIGHHRINRWQGMMIVVTYISYIGYMIVQF